MSSDPEAHHEQNRACAKCGSVFKARPGKLYCSERCGREARLLRFARRKIRQARKMREPSQKREEMELIRLAAGWLKRRNNGTR